MVFEKCLLGRIFRPKRNGEWRRVNSEIFIDYGHDIRNIIIVCLFCLKIVDMFLHPQWVVKHYESK